MLKMELGMDQAFSLRMRRYLHEKIPANGTAVSAALIHGGSAAAAAIGTNAADAAPVTIDDRFGIASISKVYCAMAVLALAEQGKLDLDAPVADYLPRFRMRDPRYSAITPRMCLNHSSGLPGTNARGDITTQWLFDTAYDKRYDYFARSDLKADPGAFSTYCNDGFSLAEMVVAAVSGREYIDFVRERIALPVGADSTGNGDPHDGRKRPLYQKNCPAEYIISTGSGGIVSTPLDCAKIGSLFLDTRGILADESIRQIVRPLGKLLAEDQGLGWDTVNFRHRDFDFGPGVLGKRGSTIQYSAYLLVSRKYGFSAAISATTDVGVDVLDILCELSAQYLEERQYTNVRCKQFAKTAAVPVPGDTDWEAFQGIYMTAGAIYRALVGAQTTTVERYEHRSGWLPYAVVPRDTGIGSVGDGALRFREEGAARYLLLDAPSETMVIGQQIDLAAIPALHGKWNERVGKPYLACNMHPGDYQPVGGFVIERWENSGILLFRHGPSCALPVFTRNSMETEYLLDAPGYPGSQNTFAPYVFEKDGGERIYSSGFVFVGADTLDMLEEGRVQSDRPCLNRLYKITAGKRLAVAADAVRIMMFDMELRVHCDTLLGGEMPLTCDGYIVFAAAEPMDIAVKLE